VTLDEAYAEREIRSVVRATGAGLPRFLAFPASTSTASTRITNSHPCQPDGATTRSLRTMTGLRLPRRDVHRRKVAATPPMDAVRTARRLGAKPQPWSIGRSEAEMPARSRRGRPPSSEGIDFRMLTTPSSLSATRRVGSPAHAACAWNWAKPTRCGRRSPVEIKGSDFVLPANVAHHWRGHHAESRSSRAPPGPEDHPAQLHLADPETTRTSSAVSLPAATSSPAAPPSSFAMGAGRKAAVHIHEYLHTGAWEPEPAVTV